jgi:hypothetical protein
MKELCLLNQTLSYLQPGKSFRTVHQILHNADMSLVQNRLELHRKCFHRIGKLLQIEQQSRLLYLCSTWK